MATPTLTFEQGMRSKHGEWFEIAMNVAMVVILALTSASLYLLVKIAFKCVQIHENSIGIKTRSVSSIPITFCSSMNPLVPLAAFAMSPQISSMHR
jgi:hypothetical protein